MHRCSLSPKHECVTFQKGELKEVGGIGLRRWRDRLPSALVGYHEAPV